MRWNKRRISVTLVLVLLLSILVEPMTILKDAIKEMDVFANTGVWSMMGVDRRITTGTAKSYSLSPSSGGDDIFRTSKRNKTGSGDYSNIEWAGPLWKFTDNSNGLPAWCMFKDKPYNSADSVYPVEFETASDVMTTMQGKDMSKVANALSRYMYPAYEESWSIEAWAPLNGKDFKDTKQVWVKDGFEKWEWPSHGQTKMEGEFKTWKKIYDTMTALQSSAYRPMKTTVVAPNAALTGNSFERFGSYVVWSLVHDEGPTSLKMKTSGSAAIFNDELTNSRVTGKWHIIRNDTNATLQKPEVMGLPDLIKHGKIPSVYSSLEELATEMNTDKSVLLSWMEVTEDKLNEYVTWGDPSVNNNDKALYMMSQAYMIGEVTKGGIDLEGNPHIVIKADESRLDSETIDSSEDYIAGPEDETRTTNSDFFHRDIEIWRGWNNDQAENLGVQNVLMSGVIRGVVRTGEVNVFKSRGDELLFFDEETGAEIGTIPGLTMATVRKANAGETLVASVVRQGATFTIADGGIGSMLYITEDEFNTAMANSPVFEDHEENGNTVRRIKPNAILKFDIGEKLPNGGVAILPEAKQVEYRLAYNVNGANIASGQVAKDSEGVRQNTSGFIPEPLKGGFRISYATPTFKLLKTATDVNGAPVKIQGGSFSIIDLKTGQVVMSGLTVDAATGQIRGAMGSLQLPDGNYQLVENQVPSAADGSDMDFKIADPVNFTIPNDREVVMKNEEKPKSFWVMASKIDEDTMEILNGGDFRLAKISGSKRLGYKDEPLKEQVPFDTSGGVIPHKQIGNYVIWEVPAEIENAGTDNEWGGPGSYAIFEINPPNIRGTTEPYPIHPELDWDSPMAPGHIIQVAKDHELGTGWYNTYIIELKNRRDIPEYGSFKLEKRIQDPMDVDIFEAVFALFEDDGVTPVDLSESAQHPDWIGDYKGGNQFAPVLQPDGSFLAHIVGLRYGATYILKEVSVTPPEYKIPSGLDMDGSGVSVHIKHKARYEPEDNGTDMSDYEFYADIDYKFNNLKDDPVSMYLVKRVRDQYGAEVPNISNGAFRFEAIGEDGSVYQAVNVNGFVTFEGLTKQKYIVREIDFGDYIPDPELLEGIEVDLTNDDRVSIPIGNYTNTKPGIGLKVIKEDEYGRPLMGVKFELYDMSETPKKKLGEYTTDHEGAITVEGLKASTDYELVEIEHLPGFKPLDGPIKFNTADATGDLGTLVKYVNLKVVNESDPVEIGLYKYDTSGNLLPGAEFKIEYLGMQKEKQELIFEGPMTSHTMKFKDAKAGWYRVTETKAPKGYEIDPKPQEKYIAPSSEVGFSFYNKPLTGGIEIVKRLESNPFNKSPLGAKFRLRGLEAHNDYIDDHLIIDSVLDDGNGFTSTKGLPYGRYSLEEIEAPSGFYMLKDGYVEFDIDDTTKVFKYDSEWNYPDYGYVTIEKRANNDPTNAQGLDLSGFKFKLYRDKQLTDQIGGEFITDKDGATMISPKLEPGDYWFKEIEVPDGWVLDPTPIKVTIVAGQSSDTPIKVTQFNQKLSNVKIEKYQEDSNRVLAGAKFEITAVSVPGMYNGQVVDTLVTDSTGTAVSKDLPPGEYFIRETELPSGFERPSKINPGFSDPDGTTFEILDNMTTALVFKYENKLPDVLGRIRVIKRDKGDNSLLAGATFELKDDEGNSLGRQTTGSSGVVMWSNLERGKTYWLYEISGPPGYEWDSKGIPVDTGTGEVLFEVTVFNEKPAIPLYSLEVLKYDLETDKVLAGAKFQLFDDKNVPIGGPKTTPANGLVRWTDLPEGSYLVKEVGVPDGYQETNASQVVKLDKNTPNGVARFKFSNTKKGETRLVLRKYGENIGVPLEGVKFRLTNIYTGDSWIFTTNRKGEIVVTGIPPGNYMWEEISTIPGYIIGKDSEERFTLKPEGEHYSEFFNEKEPDPGDPWYPLEPSEPVPDPGDPWYPLEPSEPIPPTPEVEKEVSLQLHKIEEGSGKKLSGVQFILRDKTRGLLIGVFTTDSNGRIYVTGLKPGIYEWEEVKAPMGYEIVEKIIEVDARNPGIHNQGYSVIAENRKVEERANIKLIKLDRDTRQPLEGVRFKLINKITGEVIGVYDTDADGQIFVNNLPLGTYEWEEIRELPGYQKGNHIIEVIIGENGETYTTTIDNQKIPEEKKPISIILEKYDEKTGKELQGAIFQLYNSKGERVGGERSTDSNGKIEWYNLEPGIYTAIEVRAPIDYDIIGDGKTIITATERGKVYTVKVYNRQQEVPAPKIFRGGVLIRKVDERNIPMEGIEFELFNSRGESLGRKYTDRNGIVEWLNLRIGEYRIEEVSTKEGYRLDTTPYNVTIVRGETREIDWINYPEETKLVIEKRDKSTDEVLSGAVFEIADSTGVIVETVTTGSLGTVEVELPVGEYVVRETIAPSGYRALESEERVTTRDGHTETLLFYNEKIIGEIIINKLDAVDGSPLPNAEFVIWDSTGSKQLIKGSSGPDGLATFSLEPGKYFYQETQAPQGYLLNPELYPFEIFDNGEITKVTAVNHKPEGKLIINKKDKANDYNLANATFKVYSEDGVEVGGGTTTRDGIVEVGLEPGTYYYKEIQAPAGYTADMEPQYFKISEEGGTISFVHYNSRPMLPKTGDWSDEYKGGFNVIMTVSFMVLIVLAAIVWLVHNKYGKGIN